MILKIETNRFIWFWPGQRLKDCKQLNPPGDVIRNTKSPFYSFIGRHVSFTLTNMVGWVRFISSFSNNFCYIKPRVYGVGLHCNEQSLWCNHTYFVGWTEIYEYGYIYYFALGFINIGWWSIFMHFVVELFAK